MNKEKKIPKEAIWGSYVVLILILGSVGYYIGNKKNEKLIFVKKTIYKYVNSTFGHQIQKY